MDEQSTQLIKQTRKKVAPKPGQPERYDFEYERTGTANNFLFTEPLAGWRKVTIREKRNSNRPGTRNQRTIGQRLPARNKRSLGTSQPNKNQKPVTWQFTTDDTQIKLKRLHSQIEN